MMKRNCFILLVLMMLIFVNSIDVLAVTSDDSTLGVFLEVNEIALININPATDITMTIVAPNTAGEVPADVIDDSAYTQYTSVVPESNTRKITAQLSESDTVLAGCSLKLAATVGSGGNEGTSNGEQTLSSIFAQEIITGIGSCATGTSITEGIEDGAKLTYTLTVDNVTELIANEEKSLTVTFTLTASSI